MVLFREFKEKVYYDNVNYFLKILVIIIIIISCSFEVQIWHTTLAKNQFAGDGSPCTNDSNTRKVPPLSFFHACTYQER